MAIGISLTALPNTQDEAAQVVEVLSRAAAGLAFDGLTVSLNLAQYEPEE